MVIPTALSPPLADTVANVFDPISTPAFPAPKGIKTAVAIEEKFSKAVLVAALTRNFPAEDEKKIEELKKKRYLAQISLTHSHSIP